MDGDPPYLICVDLNYFNTTCTHCAQEFADYAYPEKQRNKAQSVKICYEKDDHTPEALGRMLAGKYHDMATQYGVDRELATPGSSALWESAQVRGAVECLGWQYASHLEPSGIVAHLAQNRGGWRST